MDNDCDGGLKTAWPKTMTMTTTSSGAAIMDKTTSVMAITTTSTANFDETHLMLATLISRPVIYQCYVFLLCFIFSAYCFNLLSLLFCILICFLVDASIPMPSPPT